jgi:hypothetical protein
MPLRIFALGAGGNAGPAAPAPGVGAQGSHASGAAVNFRQTKTGGKTSCRGQLRAALGELPCGRVRRAEFAGRSRLFAVSPRLPDRREIKLELKANARLRQSAFGGYRIARSRGARVKF